MVSGQFSPAQSKGVPMSLSSLPSLSPKESAKVIRKVLRKAFPATAFRVWIGRGSMVSSVHISWVDGPTSHLVDGLVMCFQAGHFDGMTDSYNYDRDTAITVEGVAYRPGTRHVFTERQISPKFAARLVDAIAAYWGGIVTKPVVTEGWGGGFKIDHDGYIRDDLTGFRDRWSTAIYQASQDRRSIIRETV